MCAPSNALRRRHDLVGALESLEVVGQLVEQGGLDRVRDDRVAVARDRVDVAADGLGAQHVRTLPGAGERSTRITYARRDGRLRPR